MSFPVKRWLCFLFVSSAFNFYFCSAYCNKGFFKLGQAATCHPWLTCEDMTHLEIGDLIGYGAVKQVYQTTWHNTTVAVVYVNNRDYINDFLHGLEMLKALGPNKYIVQLIGFCLKDKVYLIEYHPLGNSVHVDEIFIKNNIYDIKKRFNLCVDYVRILEFLHNSPGGKRVMCDSNSLNKTLEQYLITSSLSLILNDVDALPEVGHEGIICGHRELQGSFIAPEQKWPYPTHSYQEDRMPPYDEKVDIWKIPPVCNYFLGKSEAAKVFRYHLHPIHRKCREKYALHRPSAREVLNFYEKLQQEYFVDKFTLTREEL